MGQQQAIDHVADALGNAVESLNEPRLISVFFGMTLGLILGSIPILIPGMSSPVKLGLAGGPIIVGILMGCFGPRIHMNSYITQSANLMLRAIGLSLYLACLGLDAGRDFLATVMRPEGHRLWHPHRCHGQPHGVELCQRHAAQRPRFGGLCDGLSAEHVCACATGPIAFVGLSLTT